MRTEKNPEIQKRIKEEIEKFKLPFPEEYYRK